MKTWMTALALLASPVVAMAQDEGELKKELGRRLEELEQTYNAQRKKIMAEFEQRMAKMRAPKEKKTEATGLEGVLEKISRRLADLDERLSALEKKLGGATKEKKKDEPKKEEKKKKGSNKNDGNHDSY